MEAEFKIEDGILTKYEGSAPAVTVPNGVMEIGKKAFSDNKDLKELVMPGSVTQIGNDCFGWGLHNLRVHTQPGSPMAKYMQENYGSVTLLLDYDWKEEETL